MMSLKSIAILSCVFSLISAIGCRDPSGLNEDSETDIIDFDSGLDGGVDDAGPGYLCPDNAPDIFLNHLSPYFGGEETLDLKVIGFSSFTCSHCASLAELVKETWTRREDFRKRVRFYFHHYTRSATDIKIHSATVAAHAQGMQRFWAMHDLIYDGLNSDPVHVYKPEELVAYAEESLHLDMNMFTATMASEHTANFLAWDKQQGKNAGMSGTPWVFVCGEKVVWRSLEEVVDSYLQNKN
ncbi:MAG: thioredoxin domain-containing protein [Myxococcota bacterium]|nr:thioredoxin domain-containing protein [Myxococcota bacterium]